jgi:hypothetical protein
MNRGAEQDPERNSFMLLDPHTYSDPDPDPVPGFKIALYVEKIMRKFIFP